MEWTRIAAPSREERNRSDRITKDFIQDFGFSPSDFTTRSDGYLPGSDVQIVDKLPVYNNCIEFRGTYRDRPDAVTYKGQYPKVLMESHIDVVNPESILLWGSPYLPVKLEEAVSNVVLEEPALIAGLKNELLFTLDGKVVKDANYFRANQHYASTNAAIQARGWRIYLPGIGDAMGNTAPMYFIAKAFKDFKIKPVYDVWFCGSAGEEGKGNLDGMKQLFGYDQDKGTGTNPLNFVTHIGGESNGVINYLGSFRFEMKYTAPRTPGANPPSAALAVSSAVDKIAHIKTAWDTDSTKARTTYTVGRTYCDSPIGANVVPSCTLEVDMRSPRNGTVSDGEHLLHIRSLIEPQFKAALDEENARVGASGDAALTLSLEWFGDRPAYERAVSEYSDAAIQAWWQANTAVGITTPTSQLSTGSSSLNNNVPAAVGVPSIGTTVGSMNSTGGHAFNEAGFPGSIATEVRNMERNLIAILIAAGFNATNGAVTEPAAAPLGKRTAELP
jgi:acetylornithine deacetylase/succinyl-diaminopimelate desuccinylase-like protein